MLRADIYGRIQRRMYSPDPAPAPAPDPAPAPAPAPVIGGDPPAPAPTLGDPAPAPKAPDVDLYKDFTAEIPEGSKVTQERADKLVSDAKENNLPPDVAQKMIANEHEALAQAEDVQRQALLDQRVEWVDTLKNDPAWGGEKWNETVEMAKRGLEVHGDDDIKKFLGASGLGDHFAVIKLFARLGKMAADDTLVRSGVTVKATERSTADILYGDKKKG